MSTRLNRAARHAATAYYTWRFRRHTRSCGSGLRVEGPLVVFGEGEIVCGENLVIRSRRHAPVEIYVAAGALLRMESGVFINQGVRISCSRSIHIGGGSILGDECVLLDNDFHASDDGDPKIEPVILETGVWLASRVMVLRGVTIGAGSVVGAGSVATNSIPPGMFAAGIQPAISASWTCREPGDHPPVPLPVRPRHRALYSLPRFCAVPGRCCGGGADLALAEPDGLGRPGCWRPGDLFPNPALLHARPGWCRSTALLDAKTF